MVKYILWHTRAIRFFHWGFAAAVTIMVIMGLYIAFPFRTITFLDMKLAHLLKGSAVFIAMGLWVGRVYYGMVTGNIKEILFTASDLRETWQVLRYFLYLRPDLPPHAKYNAAQRFIFLSWYVLFPIMFITGLILFSPSVWYKASSLLTIQQVRTVHFVLAIWYAVTTPLHIYLAVTQDPAKLQAIFTGWIQKAKVK